MASVLRIAIEVEMGLNRPQFAGYVLWKRVVLLCQVAVTHKVLEFVQGGGDCKASAKLRYEETNVLLNIHTTSFSRSIFIS